MTRKRDDGVEALLRKADATLDDWFRQSRITTQQASVAFARFLDRAKRQGAGALRQPVSGLQAGLEKLSAGLEQMERPRPRRTTPAARRRVRKATATTRRSKKAA